MLSEKEIEVPALAETVSDTFNELWTVTPTGDWSSDNAAGRRLASRVISHMQEHGVPSLLAHVAKGVVDAQEQLSGVAVGFFHCIATTLLG